MKSRSFADKGSRTSINWNPESTAWTPDSNTSCEILKGVPLLKFDLMEYLFVKHFFSLFMAKTGVAFSGGGIRSAAFCSGVLRRLLQKDVKIDYLSSVSGGGYTSTAYLDWKYRNGKKDDNEWHEEFFNHMRQSAGFICHCNKPLFQAILDFLAITLVILFVSILVPALNWLAFSYPLAFVVDWLFGDTLRKETPYCDEDVRKNPNLTLQQCKEERESSGIDYELLALFLTPLGIACASFILRGISSKWQHLFSLFFHFSAGFFALVFFPWFIK